MMRPPPRTTRTSTHFPDTPLCRSPPGPDRPLGRLVVAQDTGGAIKGVVRGDFFWGFGDKALAYAGKMKSRGRYYLLLPVSAAARLDRKSTRLNSSHSCASRMPSSA